MQKMQLANVLNMCLIKNKNIVWQNIFYKVTFLLLIFFIIYINCQKSQNPIDPLDYVRLFVYVYDKTGNGAHANVPFLVK